MLTKILLIVIILLNLVILGVLYFISPEAFSTDLGDVQGNKNSSLDAKDDSLDLADGGLDIMDGNASAVADNAPAAGNKPGVVPKPKKKKASGGC